MTLRLSGEAEEIRAELLGKMERFVHSPFISILLWYDREITDLDHAWLLDTTIQWFFHKSRIRGYSKRNAGVMWSWSLLGSKTELPMTRSQILEPALAELVRFFPEAGRAKLVKSGILKEARATFSVTTGLDQYQTVSEDGEFRDFFLLETGRATDWPSTMEGAARSGRLAAGEVGGGCGTKYLVPDLLAEGLMKLF